MAAENGQPSAQSETPGGESAVTDSDIMSSLGLGAVNPGGAESEASEDETTTEGEESAEEGAGSENAGEEGEAPEGEEEEGADEPEEGEEGEEGTEESDETEGEEGDEAQPPKGIKQAVKRINRLTKNLRETEEELTTTKARATELEGLLSQAQTPVLQPTKAGPLSHLRNEREVDAYLDNLKLAKRQLQTLPDGGTYDLGDGKTVELTKEQVRERLDWIEDANDAKPKRLQQLQALAVNDGEARKVYPTLFKPGSEERRMADAFLLEVPELLNHPSHHLIIGDAIRGMKLRLEEAQKKPAAKAPVKGAPAKAKPAAPARSGKPATAAPVTTARQANASQQAERFMKTGSKNDLAALIEASS